MTDDDFRIRAEAVSGLANLFGKELGEQGLELYLRAVQTIPTERLIDGIEAAAERCQWFPVPAELRKLSGCDHLPAPATEALAWRKRWHTEN